MALGGTTMIDCKKVGAAVALAGALACQSAGADAQPSDRKAAEAEIIATMAKAADAVNRGDLKAFEALATADSQTIIDDLPPFIWRGPTATAEWWDDFGKDADRNGDSGFTTQFGKPVYIRIEGDRAFVVTPDHYTYKRHGAPMAEDSLMSAALVRTDKGWLIAGWAYAGGPGARR
jgi:hypothetical protein